MSSGPLSISSNWLTPATPPMAMESRLIDAVMSRAPSFSGELEQAERVWPLNQPVRAIELPENRQTPIALEDLSEQVEMKPLKPQPIDLQARAVVSDEELRKSAEQLVASALLMPLLEQVDASPLRPKSGPFAQTLGEKRFGPIMHQHMADRIMQARSFGLVDAVVDRMRGTMVETTA